MGTLSFGSNDEACFISCNEEKATSTKVCIQSSAVCINKHGNGVSFKRRQQLLTGYSDMAHDGHRDMYVWQYSQTDRATLLERAYMKMDKDG